MVKGVSYSLCSLAALSSLAAAKTVKVKVANGGLNYDPEVIRADVGDDIAFVFSNGSHDVVLGDFENACQPGPDAFWSGTVNIPEPAQGSATWTMRVQNADTKWIYCSVMRHCQRGMVAVINPPSEGEQTLDAFKSAAQESGRSSRPSSINGGTFTIDGDLPDFPGMGGDDDPYPSPSSSSGASETASATGTEAPVSSETPSPTEDAPTDAPTDEPTGSATGAPVSSTPPAEQTTNAAASVQGSSKIGAAMAAIAVGAGWVGLL